MRSPPIGLSFCIAPPGAVSCVMLRFVRHSKYSWRVDESWMAVERSPASQREVDRSFADEIAIDFPALGDKVARMRHAFVESDVVIDWLRAEIHLSRRQAGAGAAVPIELPVRSTCNTCGGRGEVWGERCQACEGSG